MNFIVAVTVDYAIGKNNNLLCHLSQDLKYFKESTLNKVVVMGRKTYMSLPKKPLPNRTTILLSRDKSLDIENVIIKRNFNELFDELKKYNDNDIFICGGASIYNSLMKYCKYAYITKIYKNFDADTYIDNIEKSDNWVEIKSSDILQENEVQFQFKIFENKRVEEFKL